jgi:hypothetical protein
MKIIEALKTIKANNIKVSDLVAKIKNASAIRSDQTSPYGDLKKSTQQVDSWLDMVRQTLRENEVLTRRIHSTNNSVTVAIEIGGQTVVKTIDEWLTRRKNGVDQQIAAFLALTDRGIKEEFVSQPDGTRVPLTIVRHYNPVQRDDMLATLAQEKFLIDSRLEIVNATTDLVD